jgi:hypothetical protein
MIILGRGEQVIVTQHSKDVSDDYDLELRRSVTYKADYQRSKQAAVARTQDQAAYLTLCRHP